MYVWDRCLTLIRVSCCLVCSCISWFTCCLIYLVSFVVAVPVSHLVHLLSRRVISLLLDHWSFRWWQVSQILTQFWATVPLIIWLACMICRCYLCWKHSPRRVLSTKCDASGWPWSFTSSSWVKVFWQLNICNCLFKSPSDMCAVIIHKCHIGSAFRTGWHNAVSWHGVSCFFSAKVPRESRLKRVVFMSNGSFFKVFIGNVIFNLSSGR